MINKEESGGDVTITGTVGKDVKPGDKVTVTVGGKEYDTVAAVSFSARRVTRSIFGLNLGVYVRISSQLSTRNVYVPGLAINGKDYTTTVNADGKTWNVDVPGTELAQDSNVHAKVETEDAAGNPASAEANRTGDRDVAARLFLVDHVVACDRINFDLGFRRRNVDIVRLLVGRSRGVPFTVTVTVSPALTSLPTVPVMVTSDSDSALLITSSPAMVSIVIEASGRSVSITGTVGKDVKAGDTVTVTVNGKDYTTTVNADGKTWNVDVPGTELAQDSNVRNPASAEADRGYGVDTDLPEASITIDTIAGDDVINKAESESDVTITGTVGKDVKGQIGIDTVAAVSFSARRVTRSIFGLDLGMYVRILGQLRARNVHVPGLAISVHGGRVARPGT
nr:Ig-like domain-containing protein [Alcaligenes faecalis]